MRQQDWLWFNDCRHFLSSTPRSGYPLIFSALGKSSRYASRWAGCSRGSQNCYAPVSLSGTRCPPYRMGIVYMLDHHRYEAISRMPQALSLETSQTRNSLVWLTETRTNFSKIFCWLWDIWESYWRKLFQYNYGPIHDRVWNHRFLSPWMVDVIGNFRVSSNISLEFLSLRQNCIIKELNIIIGFWRSEQEDGWSLFLHSNSKIIEWTTILEHQIQ